jgi:hypothetical protein
VLTVNKTGHMTMDKTEDMTLITKIFPLAFIISKLLVLYIRKIKTQNPTLVGRIQNIFFPKSIFVLKLLKYRSAFQNATADRFLESKKQVGTSKHKNLHLNLRI